MGAVSGLSPANKLLIAPDIAPDVTSSSESDDCNGCSTGVKGTDCSITGTSLRGDATGNVSQDSPYATEPLLVE